MLNRKNERKKDEIIIIIYINVKVKRMLIKCVNQSKGQQ